MEKRSLTERKKYGLYYIKKREGARYENKDGSSLHFLIHRSAIVALLSRADDRIPRRDDVRCHVGLDLVFREARWDFLEKENCKIVSDNVRQVFQLRHRSMKRAKTLGFYCFTHKLHTRKLLSTFYTEG